MTNLTDVEELVRERLLLESDSRPDPSRMRPLVREAVTKEHSNGRWPATVIAVAAATIAVVIGIATSAALLRNDESNLPQPSTASPSATSYPESQLSSIHETLLEASRRGEIPTISFVRNRLDRTGLVVAVSARVMSEYGADRLRDVYAAVASVPITLEISDPAAPASPSG